MASNCKGAPKPFYVDPAGASMLAAYCVYILECADGSLYTGCTNDLARRLASHQSGRASKYTRSRLPVKLCYAEPAGDRGSALKREAGIKRLTRHEKILLCEKYERKKKNSFR